MVRLTRKNWRNLDPWETCGQDNYCKRGCHEQGGCTKGCIVPRIYAHLAVYEDTGLEPEDLKKAFNETAILKLAAQALSTTPDHLRYLIQAEQDGRMAVLPVKKGTKIFRVVDIPEHKCQGRMRGHYFPSTKRIYKGVMQWEDGSDFGKTVFLTREEAEAALKGGEG